MNSFWWLSGNEKKIHHIHFPTCPSFVLTQRRWIMSTKEVLQSVWKALWIALPHIVFNDSRGSETLINIWMVKEQGHLVFVRSSDWFVCFHWGNRGEGGENYRAWSLLKRRCRRQKFSISSHCELCVHLRVEYSPPSHTKLMSSTNVTELE